MVPYKAPQINIMRTAFLTAFPKIFTNIPYSLEIFNATLSLASKYGFSFSPEQFTAKMTLEIEARHKAANAIIQKELSAFKTKPVIIEIASGMSPRALEFTNYVYYEIDFPPIMEQKFLIYKALNQPKTKEYLIGMDLSATKQLQKTITKISDSHPGQPLFFLSEGLFWYLDRTDIGSLSSVIYSFINDMGGCWISTDCPVAPDQPTKNERYRSIIVKSSNREDKKPFHTPEEFMEFFRNMNFSIKQYTLLDEISPADLSSGKLFNYTKQEITDRLNSYTDIAVLRSASH